MSQHGLLKYTSSLIQNGDFTQGLSYWIGSYLRHVRSQSLTNSGNDPNAPLYSVKLQGGPQSDFLDGIPRGINQFIDLPDIYQYPSQRISTNLRLRFLAEGALIQTQANTMLNSELLAEGDPLASGAGKYFQHPFLFIDDNGSTPIEVGTVVSVTDKTFNGEFSGEYRAGSLIKDTSVSNTEPAEHILPVYAPITVEPKISSVGSFDRVTAEIGGPNIAGEGVIRFIGPNFENIINTPRRDGTTGIKIGDSLIFNDLGKAVEIISVGTTNLTDSYNVGYRNITGSDPITSGTSSSNWSILPILEVDATYTMPIFRYDYTLAYTYLISGVDEPKPAKIGFRQLGALSINGIGDEIYVVPSSETNYVDIDLADSFDWRRRLEYFITETTTPIQGRMLLTIPPPNVSLIGNGAEVINVSYDTVAHVATINYTANAENGDAIITAAYNDSTRNITLTGFAPFDFVANQTVYLSGHFIDTAGTNGWLNEMLDLKEPFRVVSVSSSQVVIRRTNFEAINNSGTTVTGLDQTPIRITSFPPLRRRIVVGDEIRLVGTYSPDVAWIQPLFDNSSAVATKVVESINSFISANIRITIPWPSTIVPTVTSTNFTNSDIEIGPVGTTVSTAIIGDVSLWPGFKYYRLNTTDVADILTNTPGPDVSIDPLISHIDPLSSLIPKGTMVIYAGGGVCPSGFKPVRNFADSNPSQRGLRTLYEMPWPDSTVYDSTTDTTLLTWATRRFDQLDDNGNPIILEVGERYVNVELPSSIAGGTPITQQIRFPRAKQIVEPGMMLRVQDHYYEAGSSSLITSEDYTEFDKYAPYSDLDRGFLVSDLNLTINTQEEGAQPSAKAFKDPRVGVDPNVPFSTYGGGYGNVGYPSVVPAVFDFNKNVYPEIIPDGPGIVEQTEVFPFTGKPFAYLVIKGFTDGSDPYQYHFRMNCRRLDSNSDQYGGFQINGTTVNETSDAMTILDDPASADRIVDGDVFFVSIFAYPDNNNIPPNLGVNNILPEQHSSFVGKIRRNPSNSNEWQIFKYDHRSIKFLRIGQVNSWPQDVEDTLIGNEINMIRGLVVLRPAKLYGTPGQAQSLQPVPGAPFSTPQGTGDGFIQQRLNVNNARTWVTRRIPVGTTIRVTGELERPHPNTASLFLEPSGYLRYDEPKAKLDYGASGHIHRIESNADISLDNPLPRLTAAFTDEYTPERLPAEHGHGSLGRVVYPLPKANLFTLCVKI